MSPVVMGMRLKLVLLSILMGRVRESLKITNMQTDDFSIRFSDFLQ